MTSLVDVSGSVRIVLDLMRTSHYLTPRTMRVENSCMDSPLLYRLHPDTGKLLHQRFTHALVRTYTMVWS